jgi:hypothetical protein
MPPEHEPSSTQAARVLMMLARVGQRDAAEELTQDTLLAVVAGCGRGGCGRPEPGRVRARVARNLANNHIRQRSAEPAFTEVHDDLHVAAPAIDFDDEERMRLVRREISRLNRSTHHPDATLVEGAAGRHRRGSRRLSEVVPRSRAPSGNWSSG